MPLDYQVIYVRLNVGEHNYQKCPSKNDTLDVGQQRHRYAKQTEH